MASRDKKDLHLVLVVAYEKAVTEFQKSFPEKPQPFITCTFRSNKEQDALFAQGRTAPGAKVTNAQAGQSPHNFPISFAFDIAFLNLHTKQLDWNSDLFELFANIIRRIEPLVVWGFDWNGNRIKDKNDFDRPHFELNSWKTLV